MQDVLYVVETETDIFVGRLQFVANGVIIRNGFAGHPKIVSAEEITQLMPAYLHPAIEGVNYPMVV